MAKRERESDTGKKSKKHKIESPGGSARNSAGRSEGHVKADGGIPEDKVAETSSNLRSESILRNESSNIEEEKPVFFQKRVKLGISLLPWSLKNCDESVKGSIRKMLLKYSDGLGGILLAFDDVRLCDREPGAKSQGKGWILNEL
jgi:hypothetical protein